MNFLKTGYSKKLNRSGDNILNARGGFSLAELIVVTAVIAIITAVTIFSFTQHQESASIDLAAEEIMLNIQESQTKAISFEGYEGNFTVGYGVNIKLEENEVITFVDADSQSDQFSTALQSFTWDPTGSGTSEDEQISQVNVPKDVFISSICAVFMSGEDCRDIGNELNIVFFRPTRQPYLNNDESDCDDIDEPTWRLCSKYRSAEIELESVRTGQKRLIKVYETGRVDVINPDPSDGDGDPDVGES